MTILDTSTPLKIKHIIIVFIAASVIFFGYSMYKQVKLNQNNIEVMVEFLQKASQPQK